MQYLKNIRLEITIEGNVKILDFKQNHENGRIYSSDSGIIIEAITNEGANCYHALRQDGNDFYMSYTEIIIEKFIDKYNEQFVQLFEDLESGVESTNEDAEESPNIIVPYDPNSIRVTQGRFSLKEIFEMIIGTEDDESILDLSPDFQRGFVWDNTRKSRLIESILLKIPLPVFYLSRDREGKYQVVDGVQRFSTIKEFFSNEFKLRNLEYLKVDCNNKFFQKENKEISLHPKFVRGLKSYQIDCNIIEPDTPHKVKLDIFKRLNTGGRSLNNQEIRNSILRKDSRNFIRKLAESKEFLLSTNKGIKPKRMMDQEMIVRYIGFYFIYKKECKISSTIKMYYNGRMSDFLDNVVGILNTEYKSFPFNKLEKDFYCAMKNAYTMFEDYSFRKVESNYANNSKNMINKSLFTVFAILLSDYDNSIISERGNVLNEFAERLECDEKLFDAITYASNDKIRIDNTFAQIKKFLEDLYWRKK